MTKDDWYVSGPGRGTCKKCGEERMVQEVADARGVQNFCMVCSHVWWLSGPITLKAYREQFPR